MTAGIAATFADVEGTNITAQQWEDMTGAERAVAAVQDSRDSVSQDYESRARQSQALASPQAPPGPGVSGSVGFSEVSPWRGTMAYRRRPGGSSALRYHAVTSHFNEQEALMSTDPVPAPDLGDVYDAITIGDTGTEPDAAYKPCSFTQSECNVPEQEISMSFQPAGWYVLFSIAGDLVDAYFDENVEPDSAPAVTPPHPESSSAEEAWWFKVTVWSTNSNDAIEQAREAIRNDHGITGDGMAVMDGRQTAAQADVSVQQLELLHRWARAQLAFTASEDHETVTVLRGCVANLERAGAGRSE